MQAVHGKAPAARESDAGEKNTLVFGFAAVVQKIWTEWNEVMLLASLTITGK